MHQQAIAARIFRVQLVERLGDLIGGLDLVKLVAGSHGTLAFLTEVTFRVPPRPKTEQTVVLSGLNDA